MKRRHRLKCWVVSKLPNGDIRNPGQFVHYCAGGCCRSEADFRRKLKWFVAVVAGKLCKVFVRTRWRGADETIDWIGVMTNIYGILPIVYREWFQMITGKTV